MKTKPTRKVKVRRTATATLKRDQRAGRVVVLPPRTASWDSLQEALEMFEPGLRLLRKQPALAEMGRPAALKSSNSAVVSRAKPTQNDQDRNSCV